MLEGGGGGQQACYVNEGWGGGGNRLGLVTKQQAVEFLAIQALEFPQVLASSSIVFGPHACLPSPPPPLSLPKLYRVTPLSKLAHPKTKQLNK